jgi:hypothetical protein
MDSDWLEGYRLGTQSGGLVSRLGANTPPTLQSIANLAAPFNATLCSAIHGVVPEPELQRAAP